MKKTSEILNNYIESCKIYYETRDIIYKLCKEIWSYIYENYAECLEYGRYSAFIDWDLDDTHLSIEYYRTYYDLHESTWFDIPLSVIDNEVWKKFIDDYFSKIKAEIDAEKAIREAREKEKRQKLYEELKQEFENGK